VIYCHCCQVLTASVLTPAIKQSIPYTVTVHDGWWISPFQFLVNDNGKNFDHQDPIAHLDSECVSDSEISEAYSRRSELIHIINHAQEVNIVSESFARLYRDVGVKNIKTTPNKVTDMSLPAANSSNHDKVQTDSSSVRICFIGGMSAHKGYYILVAAAELLPPDLKIFYWHPRFGPKALGS
jgi:glycosyltransferase involved in cell wall biosynthesis